MIFQQFPAFLKTPKLSEYSCTIHSSPQNFSGFGTLPWQFSPI